MKYFITAALIGFLFQACDTNDDTPAICTEEFRTIGVTITGAQLDEFYTVRTTTNDTIRLSQIGGSGLENFYPILNDGYHSNLVNDQATFTFHGFEQEELIVNEDYVIKGDECHIELVSGKTEIQL